MNQMLGPGVRTLAETRDGRIMVTITVDTQESMREGIEEELARYRRAHVCTTSCTGNRHVAFTGRKMIDELETSLQELRDLVAFKSRVIDEIAAERDRLAERAREARDAVNGRDLAIGELATVRAQAKSLKAKLTQIRGAVYAADVRQATAAEPVNPDVNILVRAVREIRDVLSSSPDTGTSQA